MSKFKQFVTPHCHVQSLDSASTPLAFLERELELGTGAITCTDHGTLHACRTVYDLARDKKLTGGQKIIPILGLESYLRDESDPIFLKAGIPKKFYDAGTKEAALYPNGTYREFMKYAHVTMHALDQEAFECMVRLLSKADERAERHGSERKPIFNWENLEELGGHNVTMTSSCLIGAVGRHILDRNDFAMARSFYEKLRGTVKPGNFFVELFPISCDRNWVSGVFLELDDGTKLKYYADKLLRTNVGEIKAKDLAAAFARKGNEHQQLTGVCNSRVWQDLPGRDLTKVAHVEDFLKNECRVFSPTGDVQQGINGVMKVFAKQYGDPILASDDSHYSTPDYRVVQDVRLAQSGNWRFAGCFESSTPVDMADGTTKKISDISVGDLVKTYDFNTGVVIAAPVTAVLPTPATVESFVAHEFLGYGGRGQRRAIVSTPSHHFWTAGGWQAISDIDANIGILESKPNPELMEVLCGALLGDGSISLAGRRRTTPYFAYSHAENQACLTRIMAKYLNASEPVARVTALDSYSVQRTVVTNSAHPMFAEQLDRWYPGGRKIVPKDLVLTPRMLAWWFMDDGTICRSRPRHSNRTGGLRSRTYQARLYTNGFVAGDVDFLISELDRFGIKSSKYHSGHLATPNNCDRGWYIIMNKTAWDRLSYVVSPFIPPDLRYKLSPDTAQPYQIDTIPGFRGETIYCVAKARPRCLPTRPLNTSTKYDIEVANTHCFFVDGLLVHNSYHRRTSQEAFDHFKHTLRTTEAEFEGWVENSLAWADRFKDFTFKTEVSIPTKFYEPSYCLHSWHSNPKVDPKDHSLMYTMELIKKHGRMDWKNPVYVKRLQDEIKLLHNNGTLDLLPYFFVVEEACDLYSKNGLLTGPGRGSAAGLSLAYLLGITHVDPIKYSLSVDRFLTLDRIKSGKMPDIDTDFPHRDLLTDEKTGWLKTRFGDHFAQLSVDITLKLKSAIKDTARLLHDPKTQLGAAVWSDIEMWTRKLVMPPMGITDHDFVMGYESDEGVEIKGSSEPGHSGYDPVLGEYIKKYPKDWEIVQKCLGLSRNKGKHACSMLIANRPVASFIPLTTVGEVQVTSYTAGPVEASGGLKYDFLTVNALNDVGDCIKLVQQRSGETFAERTIDGKRVPAHRQVPLATGLQDIWDIWDLPEDPGVFEDIALGRSETVFQFGTPSAQQWMRHFGERREDGTYPLDSIKAMATFTALDRPGPLDHMVINPDGDGRQRHNMLIEYARRAKGLAKSPDVPAVMDELVPETLGVLVFQESLQRAYQHLTGCTGPEAEEFRSNVAKKKKEKVDAARSFFIPRATAKVGASNAESIWASMVTFGQYAFNLSHAVCYSVIGYACAFLKHHYPLEWWTSVLKNAAKNEVNEKFWRHCGHLIDLPDVVSSGDVFEIQNERIRAPLSLLKGVGEAAHHQLTQYRPYTDIEDFVRKQERHSIDTGVAVSKTKMVKKKVPDPAGGKKKITVEVEETTQTLKRGYSALNRKVVYTLILSGAMDSLFPKTVVDSMGQENEVLVSDQLQMYEAALAAVKSETAPLKKDGTRKKVKVESVAPEYVHVSALRRFQMRKAILPAYAEDLQPLLLDADTFGVSVQARQVFDENTEEMASQELAFFTWTPPDGMRSIDLRLISCQELERLQYSEIERGSRLYIAVPAYVEGSKVFSYVREDKRKTACKLQVDIDGGKFEFVRWPDKTGGIPEQFKQPLDGTVAILCMSKYTTDKPFALEDVRVVQQALDHKDETPNPDTEEGDNSDQA